MTDRAPITITHATPADTAELRRLWWQCFPEDRESGFIPFYFDHIYDCRTAYLARTAEGELATMILAPTVSYRINGRTLDLPYFQGLATAPHLQGRGYANGLLAHCLQELHGREVPLAILKPFSVPFYEKTDWQCFSWLTTVDLASFDLPAELPPLRVERLSDPLAHVPILLAIYEDWQGAAGCDSYVVRTATSLARLLADHHNDGGETLLFTQDGQAVGYALPIAETTEPITTPSPIAEPPADSTELPAAGGTPHATPTADRATEPITVPTAIRVREAAFRAPEHRLPLYAALRATYPDRTVRPELSDSEVSRLHLSAGSREPFAMARIVNARAALELLLPPNADAACISLTDRIIPQNNGIYTKCGQKWLQKPDNSQENADFCQIADPKVLTNICTGCYNLQRYSCSTPIRAHIKPAVEANSGRTSYFNEYFV